MDYVPFPDRAVGTARVPAQEPHAAQHSYPPPGRSEPGHASHAEPHPQGPIYPQGPVHPQPGVAYPLGAGHSQPGVAYPLGAGHSQAMPNAGPMPSAGRPVPSPPRGHSGPSAPPLPVKIIVAGGFGVGKTTTVRAISEIAPLTTEAEMTTAGIGVDQPGEASGKTTTTIAMDFGCVTIDQSLKLYLFGTPGQNRFAFMWDDLIKGALGALVVVDTTRLDDCWPAVDYFERAGLPFVVGINTFHGQLSYNIDEVRWALAVRETVPVLAFDARFRASVRDALLVVLDQALDRAISMKATT